MGLMENLFSARTLDTWDALWFYLGLTPVQGLAVALGTIAMYLLFLLITRVVGQRVFMKLSTFDMLIVIVLGAIMGRAMMGHTPTVSAAVIVMLLLLVLEFMFGMLSRSTRWERRINNQPVLLLADGEFLIDELRRTHITRSDVYARLRAAGIHSLSDVAIVVLERTGDISVLRAGTAIDRDMLVGIRSANRVPDHLLS